MAMITRQFVEWQLKEAVRELGCWAKFLSEDMRLLSEKCEKHGTDVLVSSLGEVQSNGLQVDRTCAKIGVLKGILRQMDREEKQK